MIGQRIPEDDEHWKNFLRLRTILDYILAPILSPDCIPYLKSLIYDHHVQFRELYPDAPITPKLHYLVHYPEMIQRSLLLWCVYCIMLL